MIARVALALLAALLLALPVGAALPRASERPAGTETHLDALALEAMPAPPTGSIYEKRGRWYAKITIGPKQRRNVALPACTDAPAADARRVILADLAVKLRSAGVALETAVKLLTEAGARTGKALEQLLATAGRLCRGELAPKAPAKVKATGSTFADVGRRWTSGELTIEFPDHATKKRGWDRDRQRMERYVYPLVGDVAIADFTLDHAEAVMRSLPPERVKTAATRRQIAQLLHRVLALAVFPLRLRASSPIPRGFMPKIGAPKAKGWIYPSEDAALLAAPAVPLHWRVLYGFLDREGMRVSEAIGLTLADVDLDRGAVRLDQNKTDDARTWALSPGVPEALRAWLARRGPNLPRSALLFVDTDDKRLEGHRGNMARQFRDHLLAAGVTREELFTRSATRQQIRIHDTRSTFITIALANDRTESWVADRTGHKSSAMINRYRRGARMAAELGLGELQRLDLAIPELRAPAGESGGGGDGEAPAGQVSTGSVYQTATTQEASANEPQYVGSLIPLRFFLRSFSPSAIRPQA